MNVALKSRTWSFLLKGRQFTSPCCTQQGLWGEKEEKGSKLKCIVFVLSICHPAHIYDMAFSLCSHHHYLPSLCLWLEKMSHGQHVPGTAAVKQTLLMVSTSAAYEYRPVIRDNEHHGSRSRTLVKTYRAYLINSRTKLFIKPFIVNYF